MGKNIIENIFLDGGFDMNIMTKELQKWLRLPTPKLAPYALRIANQTITKLVEFIKDLKIQIHGIP
jgi:hypothetical protein